MAKDYSEDLLVQNSIPQTDERNNKSYISQWTD